MANLPGTWLAVPMGRGGQPLAGLEKEMKLLVLSDLHLENGHFEPQEEAVDAAEVIILAGDIHPAPHGIEWARQTFGKKPIVYVAGNHEYFDCEFEAALELMRQTAKVHDVHFLENDTVLIHGIRFLGCTFWTDFECFGISQKGRLMERAEKRWPDYLGRIESRQSITGRLQPELTIQRHWASRSWLQAQLPLGDRSKTVVVTHTLPNKRSISPKFSDDEMNVVFCSHVPEELISRAGLWIHGHSHASVNYRIGDGKTYTRVIANPRGYRNWVNEPENTNFDFGYLVERLPDGNWAQSYEF